MRCRLAVLTMTVCLVLMIWGTVPVHADGPEAPVWTDGDFWKYKGSIEVQGMNVDLTMKMEVTGIEQVSVKGHIYECYHLDGTVGMKVQGMSLSMEMDMWARVSDIASVRARTTIMGETTTISYHPPISYPWPLQVGDQWNGTTTMVTQSSQLGDSEETADFTAEIERLTSITVPAGAFETYEIRVSADGMDSTNYYAPEVGYDVRVQSSELFGSDTPIDLVDFKFGSTTPAGKGAADFIWYVLVIVVIAVVVAVSLLMWRRRRKAAAWPVYMPPAQTPQPPQEPPPPPGW